LASDYARDSSKGGFPIKHAYFWIVISAAVLGLVPIINGYPLFYPDSGTYIHEAVIFGGVLDRPPFYSIFLRLLHNRISLWPIPFVQDLIVCYVIFRVLPIALPDIKAPRIALVVVLSGILTSLPWFSNQIMPDIYTPLIVLVIFALCLGLDHLGRAEQFLMSVMLLAMIAFHQANTLFTILVLAAALMFGWWRGSPRQELLRSALLVVVPLVFAMLGQSLYSYAMIKRFTPAPYSPFFLLSRLLDDGPAHRYLMSACPAAQYTLCRYQDTLRGGSSFLWAEDSPKWPLIKERGWGGALDEASAIVKGTIRAYPGDVLRSALGNATGQLVHAATVEGKCCGEWAEQVVAELFPREYPAYKNSLQYRGALPSTVLTWVDGIVLVVSVLFLLTMALTRQPALGGDAGRLLALIMWAYFVNAALMGTLSEIADRYQSRIAWLIPFFALALLAEQHWTVRSRGIFRREVQKPGLPAATTDKPSTPSVSRPMPKQANEGIVRGKLLLLRRILESRVRVSRQPRQPCLCQRTTSQSLGHG
jgi:hypothetical protein